MLLVEWMAHHPGLAAWAEFAGVLTLGGAAIWKLSAIATTIREGFCRNNEDHISIFHRLDDHSERMTRVETGLDDHLKQEDAYSDRLQSMEEAIRS